MRAVQPAQTRNASFNHGTRGRGVAESPIAPNGPRATIRTSDTEPVDPRHSGAEDTRTAVPSSADCERELRNAAERGDIGVIDALISAGTDPNARNAADNTALHYAAWRGRTGAIAALLAAGANPQARNCYGATPFDIAQRERHREAAEVLGNART